MEYNSKQVKVLHYVSKMNRGGQETFIMNLFRKIDRNKINFGFLCSEEGKGDYDEEIFKLGGKIYHISLNRLHGKIKQLDNTILLYRYLRTLSKEYTVFHIHTQHAMDAFLDSFAAKLAGVRKVVVHSHSTSTLWHVSAHKIFRVLLNFLPIEKFACSAEAGKWMYGKANFRIIRNGIDLEEFKYDANVREEIRRTYGWTEQMVIGHVGSFSYPKNHEYLIEIFNQYYKKSKNSKLVLVGKGDLQENIEKKVKQYGLDDAVSFLGSRSDVGRLCQGMDVFVFPSRYEGLPVVLVEAQASGLPCVVSDTITHEIDITDGLFRLNINDDASVWAEKIEYIVNNAHDRANTSDLMKNAGFSMDDVAQELEIFYMR